MASFRDPTFTLLSEARISELCIHVFFRVLLKKAFTCDLIILVTNISHSA